MWIWKSLPVLLHQNYCCTLLTLPECIPVLALSPDIQLWALRKASYLCDVFAKWLTADYKLLFVLDVQMSSLPANCKTCTILYRGVHHCCNSRSRVSNFRTVRARSPVWELTFKNIQKYDCLISCLRRPVGWTSVASLCFLSVHLSARVGVPADASSNQLAIEFSSC